MSLTRGYTYSIDIGNSCQIMSFLRFQDSRAARFRGNGKFSTPNADMPHKLKSMAQYKTVVTHLITHWSYCNLALSNQYKVVSDGWTVIGSPTFNFSWIVSRPLPFLTQRLAQLDQHFTEEICKCIFLDEKLCIMYYNSNFTDLYWYRPNFQWVNIWWWFDADEGTTLQASIKTAIWRWQTPQLPGPERPKTRNKTMVMNDEIEDLSQVTY